MEPEFFDAVLLKMFTEHIANNCEREAFSILSITQIYNERYIVVIRQAVGMRVFVLYPYHSFGRMRIEQEHTFGHWIPSGDAMLYLGEGNWGASAYFGREEQG
jgi:hypothetical protein